jgi:hypothetical protein
LSGTHHLHHHHNPQQKLLRHFQETLCNLMAGKSIKIWKIHKGGPWKQCEEKVTCRPALQVGKII